MRGELSPYDLGRVVTFLRAEPSWHYLTRRAELSPSYAPSWVVTFLRTEPSWHCLMLRAELALSYALSWVGTFFLSGDDIHYRWSWRQRLDWPMNCGESWSQRHIISWLGAGPHTTMTPGKRKPTKGVTARRAK